MLWVNLTVRREAELAKYDNAARSMRGKQSDAVDSFETVITDAGPPHPTMKTSRLY